MEETAKLEIQNEIRHLKDQKNAVILAHYYQEGEIQDIADFVGDSLELARKAKETKSEVILFAGVHFMAETAKILSPDKRVLLPDLNAGCSLADSCPPSLFKAFREAHPRHYSITYINCSAEVKALSDLICTSSNAERLINQIPLSMPVLFAPDKNLGKYLINKTGRQMLLWEGSCIVHERFNEGKLLRLIQDNPGARVIAHPECGENILSYAHFIGSTSKLLKFIQSDNSQMYIVLTESGILHQMRKSKPEKTFIPAPPDEPCACNDCPYMKLNTLEKLYQAIKNDYPEIIMDEELRLRALKPIEKMLLLS